MASFYGVRGRVQFGSNLLNVTGWRMNVSREVFDITTLDTSTNQKFKSFLGGHTEWSGSFEGFLDDTTLILESDFDTSVTATFTDGDTNTYTGTCFITSLDIENDHNDVGKYTASFQGSSTLTIS